MGERREGNNVNSKRGKKNEERKGAERMWIKEKRERTKKRKERKNKENEK